MSNHLNQLTDATVSLDNPMTDGTGPAEAAGQWRQFLQADLLEELDPVVGHCQKLLGEVREKDRPADYLSLTEKMYEAAQTAYRFTKRKLADADFHPGSENFTNEFRAFRHDLKNQLNQTLGFCQLLQLEEVDHFDVFAPDLERIQEHGRETEAVLLRYTERTLTGEDGGVEIDTETDLRASSHGILIVGLDEPDVAGPELYVEPARILLADDNVGSREVLAALLKKSGHIITEAGHGEEAMAFVEHGLFDLLLIDVLMPTMNGFQVLKRLKQDARFRHLPVILISGLDRLEDIIRGIEMGAEDYLTKPINHVLLKARVNACLVKQQMRVRELAQFFPAAVARRYAQRPDLLTEGRDADVTILFGDITGFSRISERLAPAVTVRWLSEVMDALSACVIDHQGTLVDYIGDEIMAMWGAPEEQPDHAQLAARAALAMQERLAGLNARWGKLLHDEIKLGVGLNSGIARVGNTGSSRRFKYGPLGNTVNLASRVQGATRYLRTRVIVTESTHQRLGDCVLTRQLCTVRVKNIVQPVGLYEIVTGDLPNGREFVERYESALRDFEQGRFYAAAATLASVLAEHPQDGPSLLLLSRAVQSQLDESGEFDPVWELPGK